MDALAEKLSAKLEHWWPITSTEVRVLIAEIITQADEDALDLSRSGTVEQEVLDMLDDGPTSR